jgi:hypothetical protein
MAKLDLAEGVLDRFYKNVEKKINKMKQKNARKVLSDPKTKRELEKFVKSLGSLEDALSRIPK